MSRPSKGILFKGVFSPEECGNILEKIDDMKKDSIFNLDDGKQRFDHMRYDIDFNDFKDLHKKLEQ